ncbi:MAG: NAD(P)H-hydrate epimerase [Candidatus Dormibacteria bacterium]
MSPGAAATSEQARALDLAAERQGVPTAMLMAVAGFQVARVASRLLAEMAKPTRVVVLAGKGNNGADALVAARHLAAWGNRVRCLVLGASSSETAADLARAAAAAGAELRQVAPQGDDWLAAADWAVGEASLVVDGLLGTGAKGAPRGEMAALIARVNHSSASVLAIDLPSGLDCDSGAAPGECVRADHTLMLGVAKRGCMVVEAGPWVGRPWVADIGIPGSCYLELGLERPSPMGPDPA